ncbi:MAG: hypothetical protein ACYCYN_03155 [Solirubrobacteraceae bacterium]
MNVRELIYSMSLTPALDAADRVEMRDAGVEGWRISTAVADLIDDGTISLATLRAAVASTAHRADDVCRTKGGYTLHNRPVMVGRGRGGRAVPVPLALTRATWLPGVVEIRLQGEG